MPRENAEAGVSIVSIELSEKKKEGEFWLGRKTRRPPGGRGGMTVSETFGVVKTFDYRGTVRV
ncbi:hypothetical protein AKJ65_01475 [candidate division MSBL1 archaeon SCGC-AAA259E19]|uniref:Uncharacterized protein n=1 Tax=candidate division MSBL1 archaeon SCGC-AAA259E19 TaxID=1698264 RepID=A0A133UMW6_9EURY|nr:hypothetical protein AKJ65_01475 [candidate division MSBL1 archaeon SCGC-AAA259E19]